MKKKLKQNVILLTCCNMTCATLVGSAAVSVFVWMCYLEYNMIPNSVIYIAVVLGIVSFLMIFCLLHMSQYQKDTTVVNVNEKDGTVVNKDEKDGTVANKDEKDGTVANKDEKDGTVVNKDEKDGTVVNKDEKDGAVVNKDEKDGAVVNKDENEKAFETRDRLTGNLIESFLLSKSKISRRYSI
ncbi:hypothetical protein [Candidatus Neoehrlichia procyonis]|uniref:Uncharacterized protein n=1 Tax=Candidatus Neoehrlichia procyonis str. RAC413 TaxID=1359163 RepID=A0A0F3NL47_9RICK|nr:hypothetical protein [Candidatus Neoehrlichia lotoris]KJV68778.1 hypothetical protein NLO413_0142 [Candidatus Neoehrlichia lotoris str. RAC413]